MPRIRRALALSLLLACAPESTALPTTAEPARHEHEPEPTAVAVATEPAPEPAETGPEPDHGHGVLHDDLNAKYAEQTDVRKWQASFERRDREVVEHRDEIVAQMDLKPGMAVADIGAGTGLFTFALADAVGRTGTVIAVDVQSYFLQHLRDTAKRKKLPQVQTAAATQRSPNLAPASIDVAFFCDAYHHIEHPAPYLAEVLAALRPGGRLVIVDYAKSESAKPFVREHLRATPQEFRAEIEAAGFRFEREWDGLEENFLFVFRKAK